MHRDLKPLNVLINKTGEVKLCDFGEARLVYDYASTTTPGTIAYYSPERFIEGEQRITRFHYDAKVDVWSLGITLAELVLGKHPYDEEFGADRGFFRIRHVIMECDPHVIVERVEQKIGHQSEFCQFLECCLVKNPDERFSVEQLKTTNWYKSYARESETHLFEEIATQLDLVQVCVKYNYRMGRKTRLLKYANFDGKNL